MNETTERVDPGRTVGRYRLLRRLGRGGFGEVFLGEDEDGARAAVKLLHASWAADADMRRRFAAEVEQARRVSGFCVAAILDADPDADEPWIATEFIDGPTLQQAVTEDGPRTGADLQRLAVSTATALAAIHAAGVVHRDLKPDNIMLAPDGPRVIDFGIARAVESTSVTASGIVGTVGYMAPEQLEGMRIGAPVDVFSWAAVMVFAATGREAFPGPTQASRITRILSGEPDTGDLSGPLLETILACLSKNPKARPQARDLLGHLVAGSAPSGVAPTKTEGAPRPDPTLSYTRMERPDPVAGPEAAHMAPPPPSGGHRTPPPREERSTPRPPHGEGRADSGAWGASSGPRGGVPPYHFGGTRFVGIEELAAAFQRNWVEALRVFADPEEFAALGSWVMHDLGDTRVDRALFRREVRDVNLALATFIAEAAPELPPRFRGHDASIKGLAALFHDPTPLVSGDPRANELIMTARPQVLFQMSRHGGGDSAHLASLARDVERAERAGLDFQRELIENLDGWRDVPARVDPALALVFLLRPETVLAPDPGAGAGPETGAWIRALWSRVEATSGADRAGSAAAVYGVLGVIVSMTGQRRELLRELEARKGEQRHLVERDTWRSRHDTALLCLPLLAIASCGVGGGAAAGPSPGLGGFLLTVAALAGFAFMVLLVVRMAEDGRVRSAERRRSNVLPTVLRHTGQALRRMDQDLERARRICSRPHTGA
ncbi:serine/threonine protein kinase [Nocardiopsis alba]|uniref:serine/threonine protein kinase n=1 Tax=Nocardiopsis alba TaxID=53437 RepID=UPI0030B852B8